MFMNNFSSSNKNVAKKEKIENNLNFHQMISIFFAKNPKPFEKNDIENLNFFI